MCDFNAAKEEVRALTHGWDEDGLRAVVADSARGSVRWAVAVQGLTQLLAKRHRWVEVLDWEDDLIREMGRPSQNGPWGEMWNENQHRRIKALTEMHRLEEALRRAEQFEEEAYRWLLEGMNDEHDHGRRRPEQYPNQAQDWWCLVACMSGLKNRVGLLDMCGRQNEVEDVLRAARQVPRMSLIINMDPEEPPPGLPDFAPLRCILLGEVVFVQLNLLVARAHRLMELPPADREREADALEREVEVIVRKVDSGWGIGDYTSLWKREAYWKLAFALRDGGFPERAPAFREKALEFTEGVCVCIPSFPHSLCPFFFLFSLGHELL